ncbi:galactoside alpha-(1,2)-fucosyltransferase 1-like [Lineus longissimus]|uniref:galactoside alpha-(1,2)-fucosyltransferase 1-like n=1 Tax=Lineus longissimus TaxID=88925 RepID=UPI00315D35E1
MAAACGITILIVYSIIIISDDVRLGTLPLARPGRAVGELTIDLDPHLGLGNHMFQYASLIGLAMSNRLVPVLMDGSFLADIFELGEPPRIIHKDTSLPTRLTIQEDKCCVYEGMEIEMPSVNGRPWRGELKGYRQSWKYFFENRETIKRHFAFKSYARDAARKFLHRVLQNHGDKHSVVAVHVRRGDMLAGVNVQFGYEVPWSYFFKIAMEEFRRLYKDVVFVVCSIDMVWSKNNIKSTQNDIVFVDGGNKPEVDLAIMANCNHTIVSVGTFGWWAGWLAGGHVIYYKTPARPGSDLEKLFNYHDYYPRAWQAME